MLASDCALVKPKGVLPRMLNPHRHQYIERASGILVLDQGGRTGVGKFQNRGFAFDLSGDIEQIARIESDIDRIGLIDDLELFGGATGIRIGHREHQSAGRERELHGAPALARYRRDAVDGSFEGALIDFKMLVVSGRDYASVVWKGAVDE